MRTIRNAAHVNAFLPMRWVAIYGTSAERAVGIPIGRRAGELTLAKVVRHHHQSGFIAVGRLGTHFNCFLANVFAFCSEVSEEIFTHQLAQTGKTWCRWNPSIVNTL